MEYLAGGDYSIFGVDSLQEGLKAAGLPKTFVAEDSRAAELTGVTELRAGGAECYVDETNKVEFLTRFAKHQLSDSILVQAALVRSGLLRVLCPTMQREASDQSPVDPMEAKAWFLLANSSLQELERFVSGEEEVDVAAWKACASFEGGFDESSPAVVWFWELVDDFDAAERAQLLAFARGSTALPPDGFAELKFVLRRVSASVERLPEAHTCEFSLDLPEYTAKQDLDAKLRRAMEEATFGMV